MEPIDKAASVREIVYIHDKLETEIDEVKNLEHYGIRIEKANSNPASRITYLYDAANFAPVGMDYTNDVFNYGSWGDAFFVKGNRPVMLNADRTVAYELDASDYSKKLDGTASDIDDETTTLNAMSEFPLIWLYQHEDENYEYIEIANYQINDNFVADAFTRADGTIADYMYLPIYGGSYDGAKLRSLSGKVMMSNTDAQTEINRAAAVGDGWTIIPWCRRNLINCLLLIIGKSENVKAVFGNGNISGYVNDAAQNYGMFDTGRLDDKGQFYGTNDSASQVKVFHMEKMWGDRWDRVAGYICDKGRIKVKMSPPYNLTASGYVDTGIDAPTANGYQKDSYMTRYGRFPKTTTGASATTYLCAYYYINLGIVAIAHVGGQCNNGASCSAASVDLRDAATAAYWHLGASLSCESPSAA